MPKNVNIFKQLTKIENHCTNIEKNLQKENKIYCIVPDVYNHIIFVIIKNCKIIKKLLKIVYKFNNKNINKISRIWKPVILKLWNIFLYIFIKKNDRCIRVTDFYSHRTQTDAQMHMKKLHFIIIDYKMTFIITFTSIKHH